MQSVVGLLLTAKISALNVQQREKGNLMRFGNQIKKLRKFRGLTQKELGILVGFPEESAGIRIAQYESGTRTPRDKILERIIHCLKVPSTALEVPSFESDEHLMHTLFMLEDAYGLEVDEAPSGEIILKLNFSISPQSFENRIFDWAEEYEKYKSGEITKEEYDHWRYNYA